MVKEIGGELNAKDKKFAIVVARFNDFLTGKLKDGAIDCLLRHGASEDHITIIWVPGSFELPYIAAKIADPKKYDDKTVKQARLRQTLVGLQKKKQSEE